MDKYELLLNRLNQYPKLLGNFESFLDIVENKNGDMELADTVEESVIGEMQELGHNILERWATKQSIEKSEQFSRSKKGRQDIKKK